MTNTIACHTSRRSYIDQVRRGIEHSRQEMHQFTESAETAAQRICRGAHLWVAGSQTEFSDEAVGRAGGLMAISPAGAVASGDVVLVATRGQPTAEDRLNIVKWKTSGAYVILFSPPTTFASADTIITSESLKSPVSETKNASAELVENIVNLWAWTGEFTSACTRNGMMPIFYKSFGLPGGREWAQKYSGMMFHEDLEVAPIAAGVIGNEYFNTIDQMLQRIEKDETTSLKRAGEWMAQGGHGGTSISAIGHIWPTHLQNVPTSDALHVLKSEEDALPEYCKLIIYLGYQQPPRQLIDRAKQNKFLLAYCSVLRDNDNTAANILYICPHWGLPDACVTMSNYNIPILPASGVIQSCILWTIVQEADAL